MNDILEYKNYYGSVEYSSADEIFHGRILGITDHITFEGDSVTVERIPEQTTDKTYVIGIQMRIGVAVVIGSKFGTITL